MVETNRQMGVWALYRAFRSGDEAKIWDAMEKSGLDEAGRVMIIDLIGQSSVEVMEGLKRVYGMKIRVRASNVEYVDEDVGEKGKTGKKGKKKKHVV